LRLIVFDCDGTLVECHHAIVATMTAAFKERDQPPPAKAGKGAASNLERVSEGAKILLQFPGKILGPE
jgi:phosphoglycolate phosphatase-like HAD superfamily hydrolase